MRLPISSIFSIAILLVFISCKKPFDKPTEYTISTGEIIEMNGNYALASGKLRMTSGTVLAYGHCWSKYQGPTIEADHSSNLGSSSSTLEFQSDLHDLEPGTIYYVRSYGMCELGEVRYGNEIPMLTPSIQVSPTSILNLNMEFLEVSASIKVHSGMVGLYGFCWATHENPSVYDSKKEFSFLPEDGKFNGKIWGLLPKKKYYIRAYGIADQIAYGPVMELYYDKVIVVNDNVTQLSNNSIEISSNIDFQNTTVVEHGHCWSLDPNPDINDPKTELGPMSLPGTFQSVADNLERGASYYIRSYAMYEDTIIYSEDLVYEMIYPFNISAFGGHERSRARWFTIDEELYVGFGFHPSTSFLEDLWHYDKSSDTWVEKAEFPETIHSNRPYACSNDGHVFYRETTVQIGCYKYVPGSDSWTEKATLDVDYAVYELYSFSYGDRVFLCASDGYNIGTYYIYEFLPQEDEYLPVNEKHSMSRYLTPLSVIDGKVYFLSLDYVEHFKAYDINSNTWLNLALPDWGYGGTPAAFEYNAKLLLHEGPYIDEYNPSTNSWGYRDYPISLLDAMAIRIKDAVFIGLGEEFSSSNSYDRNFYLYQPSIAAPGKKNPDDRRSKNDFRK